MNKEIIKKKISEMTIEEKVAQTQAVWLHHFMENEEISWNAINKYLRYGVGEIRIAGTHLRLSPRKIANLINQVQSYLIKATRHHIPALIREECLAGLMAPSATPFPQPINMASTWDEEAIYNLAKTINRQSMLLGVNHCLSPVLDLCVDPRWGRCEETFGEDPYLSAVMGSYYIRGIQDVKEGRRIISTAKHFVGYGYPEGGRNMAPFAGSLRDLLEYHLFPFEMAIKSADVGAIMVAYNEIDGIPCHANKWLLTELLRNKLRFDGLVTSDGDGVLFLVGVHQYAKSCVEAYKIAIESGIDVVSNIAFPIIPCFEEIIEEIKNGYISQEALDRAVERVIIAKYLTGVFEKPFIDESAVPSTLDADDYRKVAYEIAKKSIVLLKNNGVLPLDVRSIKTISVIGPGANDPSIMLGDYHFDAHRGLHNNLSVAIKSVYEAIKEKLSPHIQVLYARGCDYIRSNDEEMESAMEIAARS
ncbi:MAG: glycoside hydrolase family 3 protein, partial [Candidatus Bathyarchaeia archaeon]